MRTRRQAFHNASIVCRQTTPVLVAAWMFLLAGAVVVCGSAGTAFAESPSMSDRMISQAVKDALIKDPGINAALIDVVTSNGITTVSGRVGNILASDRAEKVAHTVKGVRGVVNSIDVSAPARTDAEIRQDIERAWLRNAATERYQLAVAVDGGVATLTGTVDSWQEKQLAAVVAKGVRGVTGIENDIGIAYEQDRSDFEIKTEVQGALRWDTLVDDALITVDVTDDVVTLSGTVGSAAEKTRAIADAWVTGVKSVDADDLQVASWVRDERFRKQKYVDKTDAQITAAVRDALLYDPRVKSFNVDVSVDDGVVTLSGNVDNLRAKRSAADTSRNVVGVWRVKNNVNVRPEILDDSTLKDKVERALLADPYVQRYEITVTVADNEVYLYGDVDSYFEKAEAEDIVSGISGVVAVHNRLGVENHYDSYAYNPYVDPWYLDGYAWNGNDKPIETTKADWEIKEDIEDELFWSPFVDADEVTVTVDNGEATLTGTVDTMSERSAAAKNAYDGGATSVDNNLLVTYGPNAYRP